MKFSIENLDNRPKVLRALSDIEIKEKYWVDSSKIILIYRGRGVTTLIGTSGRFGKVQIRNHTLESNIQKEIDYQVKQSKQSYEDARNRIMAENIDRRNRLGIL